MCCVLYIFSPWGNMLAGGSTPPPRPWLFFCLHPSPKRIDFSFPPLGAGVQLPETHLRWELAALWVSRVCTRLLPGTEIASSGQAGAGGCRGGGGSHVPLGAVRGGFSMSQSLPLLHGSPEEVPKCRGRRGHGSPHCLAGCPCALCTHLLP